MFLCCDTATTEHYARPLSDAHPTTGPVTGLTKKGQETLAGAAVAVAMLSVAPAGAQVAATEGQSIAPAYEGWEQNDDGSFNLVFGYFNRNWDEEIDVSVGLDNHLEPGSPDQGQPTRFLPRRKIGRAHV